MECPVQQARNRRLLGMTLRVDDGKEPAVLARRCFRSRFVPAATLRCPSLMRGGTGRGREISPTGVRGGINHARRIAATG